MSDNNKTTGEKRDGLTDNQSNGHQAPSYEDGSIGATTAHDHVNSGQTV